MIRGGAARGGRGRGTSHATPPGNRSRDIDNTTRVCEVDISAGIGGDGVALDNGAEAIAGGDHAEALVGEDAVAVGERASDEEVPGAGEAYAIARVVVNVVVLNLRSADVAGDIQAAQGVRGDLAAQDEVVPGALDDDAVAVVIDDPVLGVAGAADGRAAGSVAKVDAVEPVSEGFSVSVLEPT